MNDSTDPNKRPLKTEKNTQFSESGIFVKEDDQDWGSGGMNNVQEDSE
tara:strand:+ start:198 stop:341 length:144 start_codon:yes stop_codon:yes gene_type:complete